MAEAIKHIRGTASEWSNNDKVIEDGEIGIETDTLKFKIGDGNTKFSNLRYINTLEGVIKTDSTATIEDGDNNTVSITNDDTTNNPNTLEIINNTTGDSLNVGKGDLVVDNNGNVTISGTTTSNNGYNSRTDTVGDDSVVSFTPSSNFGKITIHDGNAEVGEYLYDISNGVITEIADLNGNIETSTSSLSGTTGTDNKITISADNANTQIDIENRLGGSRDITSTITG